MKCGEIWARSARSSARASRSACASSSDELDLRATRGSPSPATVRVSSGVSRRPRANSATSVPTELAADDERRDDRRRRAGSRGARSGSRTRHARGRRGRRRQLGERIAARVVIVRRRRRTRARCSRSASATAAACGERPQLRRPPCAPCPRERPRRRSGSITVAAWSADCIACPSLEMTRGGRSRRAAGDQRRGDRPADDDTQNDLHSARQHSARRRPIAACDEALRRAERRRSSRRLLRPFVAVQRTPALRFDARTRAGRAQ